tara:strand:+ start:19397 stop:19915 length:519 start_codon:yes stop_codon:yes gene_type:complete
MTPLNNNKYFLGYRVNDKDGWKILNRSFCTKSYNNNIIGQFLQTTWFSCLINDSNLIEFIIIERSLNLKKVVLINKINNIKNANEFNYIPEIELYCNINLNEINEIKKHLKYNIDVKKENLSTIQYYPQVIHLGIEKQFIKKKFEIQISVQRSNSIYTNKLDYLVTLPSFVI